MYINFKRGVSKCYTCFDYMYIYVYHGYFTVMKLTKAFMILSVIVAFFGFNAFHKTVAEIKKKETEFDVKAISKISFGLFLVAGWFVN